MNKIYRLRFDRRRNELVVVSEITAGTGKEKSTGHIAGPAALSPFRKLMGTLTPLAFLTGLVISLLPGMALAADLPTGGQIVAGQGSITTNGNHMTVNQNTHGLVTNWNSFDIGQNHTVQFVQPDSSSVALNRVTGGHESQILGSLTANGQVMLVNPAGVMFGNGSKVNTAGLVASTKNISNADFMAGHYTFSGGSHPGAGVVNQGSLTTTKGGYIVLAADRVRNQGTIITPGGKTVLAAADTVKLQLDNTGLTSVSVSGNVVNALVENSGLLSATNGQVYLTARGRDMLLNTVVNNTGSIEAKGLESRGGEIVLDGGDSGVVSQSGMLLADSDTGPGGKITVEGQNIHLAAGSITSATGRAGGGEVYVGGGWQGKDSHIRNASKVVMDKTATIDVSATERGDGGTAVLWSEDYTNFNGNILAQGGAQSGNGGRVETSSHNNLQAFGTVDASASGSGKGGEWLLDPGNVNIVSDNNNTSISEDKENNLFTPTAAGARLSAKQIETQLNAGTSVTVSTSGNGGQDGNIYFAAGTTINKTEGDEVTLTLKADKDIVFTDRGWPDRNAITATGGVNNKLNLKLLTGSSGGNGQITIGKAVNISLNGGDFYAGPAEGSAGKTKLVFNDNGGVQAGNIALDTANGTTVNWSQLTANNNLTVNGPLDVTAAWSAAANLTAGGLLKIDIPTGGITATSIAKKGNGKVQLSGGDGVEITAQNGTVTMNADKDEQHGISIKSDNGSVNISGKTDKLNTTGVSLSGITLNAANNIVISGENTYSGQLAPSIIHGNWEPGVQNFVRGVNLTSANIAAKNINITGVMSGKLTTGGGSRSSGGVVLSDINMAASEKLNVTGNSTGVYSAYNMGQSGGIYITGNVKAKASQGSITGEGYANGITTYGTGTIDLTGDISVTGNNLKSYNGYSAGILFSGSWNQPTGYAFNVANGSNVTITGNGINKGVAVLGEAASSTSVSLKNQGGNVTLLGYASGDSGQGIALISDVDSGNQDKGNIILSGNGKTSLSGVAMGANGTGISKVTINTTAVTDGNASLSGSGGKNGLTINASSNISNVSITGKGETGTGVLIKGGASLSNTTITGNTDSGIGLNISGATTSDSHTVLTGTANSGTGVIVGASLSGGGEVTGSSDSGTGVLLDGGDISGGTLTAMSVTGTGLEVRSASVATDVTISAQTVTGNAISGEDKTLDAQGSTTISTVGDTGNANISENVSHNPGRQAVRGCG
ncbi:filamentous hemagglutinin N-terminal domain-containing protein [Salmonella enterica]|nr:filamentous hemagglutinin N-terminal domain-containing protein [Salmonella enterica]